MHQISALQALRVVDFKEATMSGRLFLLCSIALGMVLSPASACMSEELVREKMPNDVGIELLGKGAMYSFFYQHTFDKILGLEAGLGVLGGGSEDMNSTIAFFPVGVKLYLVPKDGSLYLTGGGTIVTAGTDSGPFEDSTSFGFLGLGFEFRATGGFIFRGTAYGLVSGDGFFIWPGLALAYSF